MPASEPTAPAVWRVVDQRLGDVELVLLGDLPTDTHRVVLAITNESDGPEVDARVVYPWRVCGWLEACDRGEGCHS